MLVRILFAVQEWIAPDMIASFMNRYEFLSRYSALITENPNVG